MLNYMNLKLILVLPRFEEPSLILKSLFNLINEDETIFELNKIKIEKRNLMRNKLANNKHLFFFSSSKYVLKLIQ